MPVRFTFPEENWGKVWFKIIDSSEGFIDPDARSFEFRPEEHVAVPERSIILFISGG
jgi:hypothetical protein